MRKPLLIGLAGPARSGKDTVANYIVNNNDDFFPTSFAAPIRQFIADLLGITLEELEGVKDNYYEPLDTTPRHMMQTLGTEWGREIVNPNIWIILGMQRVDGAKQLGLSSVLSDIRFNNEADVIRENGGIMVHIRRSDAKKVSAHSSEIGVSVQKEDFVIDNDSSLNALYRQTETMLKYAKGK